MKRILIVLLLLSMYAPLWAQHRITQQGFIDDRAGMGGKRGFSGDGDDALKARLASPSGFTMDRWGNYYIADTLNHRIRRVDVRNGRIDTVAGTGKAGFFNDGSPAEGVTLNGPMGIAFDPYGNLIIADAGNHRIRMLTVKGYLVTIAGDGQGRFNGALNTPLTTSLNSPTGVAFNSNGELYIADTGNHMVRKINRVTGRVETVAGTGQAGSWGDMGLASNAQLNAPTAILFDGRDNLYIADTRNHKIRWVNNKKQIILTLAGTGEAGFDGDNSRRSNDSKFNDPTGLAFDQSGRLYVSDTDNQRIRRITIKGIDGALESMVETVAGTGKRGYNGDNINAWEAWLAYPGAMVITPYDLLFFVDVGNNKVRRIQGISKVTAPVAYGQFGKPAEKADSHSFFEVLFGWTKKKN